MCVAESMSTSRNVGLTRISTSDVWCDSIHSSSLYDLIDRSPVGFAAVIRLIFSSIQPSIHPHSLRPDRVWACLPAVRRRRGPEEDRTNTPELECIGDGNIEIGIGDQLRQLISQVLSFPSLLCISFFLKVFLFVWGSLLQLSPELSLICSPFLLFLCLRFSISRGLFLSW